MKKSFYLAVISSALLFIGVFYSCKDSNNSAEPTLTAETLSADADFKKYAILTLERQKGLAFFNPFNTKEGVISI